MSILEDIIFSPKAAEMDSGSAIGDFSHFRKLAALGELAGGITHDFRNILQTVSAMLETISSRSDDPAEVRRLTASALLASDRGISVTDRLARFSRARVSNMRPACLLSSLESAADTLSETMEAGITVALKPPPADLWQAVVDPTEFELALINLGINARDAMPHGGCIQLSARNVVIPTVDRRSVRSKDTQNGRDNRGPQLLLPGGDYVAIVVTDTGTGMDKATLHRAAQPFFTTKPVGRGTGLGLAMAHTLAVEAGGALRLISEVGQGTTVEMWLPRVATPASTGPVSAARQV